MWEMGIESFFSIFEYWDLTEKTTAPHNEWQLRSVGRIYLFL